MLYASTATNECFKVLHHQCMIFITSFVTFPWCLYLVNDFKRKFVGMFRLLLGETANIVKFMHAAVYPMKTCSTDHH